MKYKITYLFLAFILLFGACEKDEIKTVLNTSAALAVKLSATNAVLTADNATKDALTVSWAAPDYGFSAAPIYTILIDKKGGNFSKAFSLSTGAVLSKTFKTSELNAILLNLGLAAGTSAGLDFKVQSLLGTSTLISSPVASMVVTPYTDKLDLSTTWGVVGSAAPNGWNGPDIPFYKTDKANVYVAYITLVDGEIKFRQDNKWDVNYGDDGANLSLEKGGANIVVKAGNYRITFDLGALTYAIDKYSWGVVGSATPNGWAAPDVPMWYDASTDQWRGIATLKDGEIKFRQNEDWAVNYGDTGADKTLESGGDNIKVTAGTYLITMNLKTLKYTIEAYKVWGLVGSATTNGWNGPDAKFRPNFAKEGIWTLEGAKLIDGEIKFRQNDDWAVNYGDTGADGVMESGGDNIKVTAGTYDITLDFTNTSKPAYKLTKK